ncbi:MAG: beta-phosphoglucomutase [Flexilinea sp.]
MIKGVIFDLDGVLVSTDELHYHAWKKLAEDLGIRNFTHKDNEQQRGVSRMASLEVVLQKCDTVYTPIQKKELAERKNQTYIKLLDSLTDRAILPGAIDILKMLREKGIKIAVGSGSKNALLILEKTGLIPYIDQVSSGLDIAHSKPDPEVFLIAADKLQLKPEECIVVEDAEAGIIAARSGGFRSLGVGPLHDNLKADYSSETLQSGINWDLILMDYPQ